MYQALFLVSAGSHFSGRSIHLIYVYDLIIPERDWDRIGVKKLYT